MSSDGALGDAFGGAFGNGREDYRDKLAAELARRKHGNPKYSLRAFALSLGLSPAFLSKLLRGEKDLSTETAFTIAQKLGYNEQEIAQFCQLVQLRKTDDPEVQRAIARDLTAPTAEYQPLELESFQVISDWYHYAILELTNCRKTKIEKVAVASRLGISEQEASQAISRLIKIGLLEVRRGRLTKTKNFIAASSKNPSRAIRNFHLQMIEKARRSVEEVAIDERDISGITVAISADKLAIARKEIEAFRRRLTKLVDSSQPTEVYQLNVQFFPLTRPRGTETES